MTDIKIVREPLTTPQAWRGEDLTPADYLYELSEDEIAAIEALRDDLTERDIGLGQIGPDTVTIAGLEAAVANWLDRLGHGVGFGVVRGLDIDGWTEREAGLAYYAIGRHMGVPVKQNAAGHLLGHVRDTGKDIRSDPSARGYQVRVALPFHTDTATDLLCLMCFRTAKEGGESSLAPLQTIYNEVLARRPDLVETYYQPFNFDCRDEEHPDGGPFYTRVLASAGPDGRFSLRHNSPYIMSAARRFDECDPLTDDQQELLELVDQLTQDPRIHVRFRLEQGDIVLIDNYAIAHSRAAFEDHDEPDRKRHLLRLWLVLHEGRKLAPDFDNRAGLKTTADIVEDGLAPA